EASWTQVLEMLEFMADATTIPILLDGDTGYGNFNNVRRLVSKLEKRGVAGVCIEDKLFPKTNSLIEGARQALADVDEFCGRIKAGKDAQQDDAFVIVARIEALIAGRGISEALRRGEAYVAAGADAILVHSTRPSADEIVEFMRRWDRRVPVVIVPTRYWRTPTDVLREAGVSVAVWANHMLRASIPAMQDVARTIAREEGLHSVEPRIAPVAEVFRLQLASELEEAEKRYLPRGGRNVRAIVLAASRGVELGALTAERPKAMVEIRGKPLLAHIVETYSSAGVESLTVVRGYRSDAVDIDGPEYVDNEDFASTGELVSLGRALLPRPALGETVISYGDVLFKKYIVEELLEEREDLVIAVDTDWPESVNRNRAADYVRCSLPPGRQAFGHRVLLREVRADLPHDRIHGEWMGFLKASSTGIQWVLAALRELLDEPEGQRAGMDLLL
ncbi:MAG TPA: isocitrate lyase/phosphoenolpyruvate mutase family protein, partial [Planctomycetota bacterium]|nr:isocitrate lyase/phosphoenolpyruvate mutase family protein [Planctomycetota bacterium]